MKVLIDQTQGKKTLYSCIKDFGKKSPNRFIREWRKTHEHTISTYFRNHGKNFVTMTDKEILEVIANQPRLKVEIY